MDIQKIILSCLCVGLVACGKSKNTENAAVQRHEEENNFFSVEILDDEALQVIAPDAEIKRMASGFDWVEGPLWVEEGNFLLFSDIPQNKVYKMTAVGDTSTYLYPSGYSGKGKYSREPGSNALLFNPERKLVLMQHGDRRVAEMEALLNDPEPIFSTLAKEYESQRFNSPNDGTFDKAGNLYFTDPPYGLPPKHGGKEMSFQGVYCLLKTGELVLLDSLSRPNGIALSPDEKRLYVANSDEKQAVWYQYEITKPGKVANKQLFYNVTDKVQPGGSNGLPDGMKVHPDGYVFATGPEGVWIFSPEGKVLGRIYTGQLTSNCAFSADYRQLYLTADGDILRVDLK